MCDISKLNEYSESEISLPDIVESVQDSWRQLSLPGIVGTLLVFSVWFFWVFTKLSCWFKIMAALILPLVVIPKTSHPISQRKLGGDMCSYQDDQWESGNFHQLICFCSCRSQIRFNSPSTTACVMIKVQSARHDQENAIDSLTDQYWRVK